MGGPSPLGYDAINKALVIVKAEAETVRQLFRLYLETGSVRILKQQADELGIKTKHRTQKDGRIQGGKPFSRGNFYQLLSNPLYIGRVPHHGKIYPGQHKAIVDQELWDDVQNLMATNTRTRISPTNIKSTCILTGLIYDETGDRLSPSHAIKNGVRYRYYISSRLVHGERNGKDGWRIPADQLERPVLALLDDHFSDPLKLTNLIDTTGFTPAMHQELIMAASRLARELQKVRPHEQRQTLSSFVQRIELHPNRVILEIDASKLSSLLMPGQQTDADDPQIRKIEIAHCLRKRGVESKLVIASDTMTTPNPDITLIAAIAKAHLWLGQLADGKASSIDVLAQQQNADRNEISRFLPLAYLAPDIIKKIVEGTQPVGLTVQRLRNLPALPYSWNEQRVLLGLAS